jgi:hypothetical protein
MGNLELMLLTSAGISVALIVAALLIGDDTGKPA